MAWHSAVNNENYTNLALKIIERKMAWHSAVNNENDRTLAIEYVNPKHTRANLLKYKWMW